MVAWRTYGQFALFISFNRFTQHRLKARGAFDVTGFNRIDIIHQLSVRRREA